MPDLSSFKGKSVSDHYEEYRRLVESVSGARLKRDVFDILCRNNDGSAAMLPIVHLYCQKLEETDMALFADVMEMIKDCKESENDWVVRIVFLALETLRRQGKTHKLKMYEVLRGRKNIENHFVLLLGENDGVNTCMDIFELLENEQAALFRCILAETGTENAVLQKNIVLFLTEMANSRPELFLNFDFVDLLDSESFMLRNCCLDIFFSLIMVYKKDENVNVISELVEIILERLLDVNHFVRAKAVQVLTALSEQQAVPLSLKDKVMMSVAQRIEDRAAIVRKKTVNYCIAAIKHHHFANNRYLRLSKKMNMDTLGDNERMYFKDLEVFIGRITDVVAMIKRVFAGLKTEIADIIEFMKIAVFYKLEGSLELVSFLCKNTENKQRRTLLNAFIELYNALNNEEDVLELLGSLEPNYLRIMHKEKVISKDYVQLLFNKMCDGIDMVRISGILKRMCYKRCDGGVLRAFTERLQKDTDNAGCIAAYKNIIEIIGLRPTADEMKQCIDNLVMIKKADFELIDITVRSIFRLPDPDPLCRYLLESLCNRDRNLAKIVYAVGAIAVNESVFVDKLEKKVPNIYVPDDIRKRRKSFNVARTSFRQSINFSMHENDLSSSMDMSVAPQNIIDGQVGLKDKTDDEIADILFYIKEKEILYGNNAILKPFVQLVIENIQVDKLDVVSYVALFRMMTVSSEFFLNNFSYFLSGLKSANKLIRYNALVATADFILLYNTYVEKYTYMLFDKLFDDDEDIVRLALHLIYYLVCGKILKIKGYGTVICSLFGTKHDGYIRSLLHAISNDENAIASVLFEVIMDGRTEKMDVIQFIKNMVKDKTKENLFIRTLHRFKSNEKIDDAYLVQLYGILSFNAKSVSDMKMNNVFNEWIASRQ